MPCSFQVVFFSVSILLVNPRQTVLEQETLLKSVAFNHYMWSETCCVNKAWRGKLTRQLLKNFNAQYTGQLNLKQLK